MKDSYFEQTDFYEFTSGNALEDLGDQIVEYDVFFRKNPWNGGYAIFSGLSNVLDFISNSNFLNEKFLEHYIKGPNKVNLSFPLHRSLFHLNPLEFEYFLELIIQKSFHNSTYF